MVKYYPVLKWKAGEQIALQKLTGEITPIIEIVESLTVDAVLNPLKDRNGIAYIDPLFDGCDAIEYMTPIIRRAESLDLQVFPVLYYTDIVIESDELSYLAKNCAIKTSVTDDLDGPSVKEVMECVSKLLDQKCEISLILDIGPTAKQEYLSTQLASTNMFIANYREIINRLNALIVCTSSFPENISDIPAGGERRYPRYDFLIFTRIVDAHRDDGILDKLSYADYGVTKYTDTDIDFSRMRYGILPKAKYTTHSEYVVLKGQKDRRTGEWVVSAKDLARIICDSNYYFGSDYSYGDAEIYKRAYDETVGGGNNTNWVTFNANHHMAVLQNQTASLF